MNAETLKRGLVGLTGPIIFAAANFLLGITLQQFTTAHFFGLFAFGQVVVAATLGLSNGLFATPLVVAIAGMNTNQLRVLGSFFKANMAFTILAAFAASGLTALAGASGYEAALFGVSTAAMLVRWFGRSADLALNDRKAASISDIVYGASGFIGILFLFYSSEVTLENVLILQILMCFASMILGSRSFLSAAKQAIISPLSVYYLSFQQHGKWSVSAVFATQITANFHAYVVTLLLGASIFAPIALANLLFRPIGVVLTGLVQFERPRLAKKIQLGLFKDLASDVRFIASAVICTWLLNAGVILFALKYFPSTVNKEGYDARSVLTALALTGVVVLIRAMREPRTAVLQAAGEFEILAKVAAICAPATIVAVVAILVAYPQYPAMSLLGAVSGELLNLVITTRAYRRFMNSRI